MKSVHGIGGLITAVLLAGAALAGTASQSAVIFREGFDDPNVAARNWYDISAVRIAGGAWAGPGGTTIRISCISSRPRTRRSMAPPPAT